MNLRRYSSLVVLAVVSFAPLEATAQVTGSVIDSSSSMPVASALVSRQGEGPQVTTAGDGSFSLPVSGTNLVIVAAKNGYFNNSATVSSPATGVQILIDPVPSCDVCHKIENVDTSKINFPGIFLGAVTFNRPEPGGDPLVSSGSQVVHDLGGVGDPAQGYYAGLSGRFFAKVNHDASGNGPTFFTDATGIIFDNRIPALASDTSNYSFELPDHDASIHVRARLIYR